MNNLTFLIIVFWLAIQSGLAQGSIVYQSAYLTNYGDTIKLDLYSSGKVKMMEITPVERLDSVTAQFYENKDSCMYGDFTVSDGDGFFGYIVNTYSSDTSTLRSQSILPLSTTSEIIQFHCERVPFFNLGGDGEILYFGTTEQKILGQIRGVHEFLLIFDSELYCTQIKLLIDVNTKLPVHLRRVLYRKILKGKRLIIFGDEIVNIDLISEKKLR